MAVFTIDELCVATNGIAYNVGSIECFTGICTDTRKVQPGDVFIALVGENFDGHEFITVAIECGAKGIIVSRPLAVAPTGITVITVANTLQALQGIACFHRKRFQIPIIAITGSNGKTTTKDMIAAVLSSKFNVLKTEANFNNEIGLPLTLLQLTKEHEVAVVEMGMRGRGQIAELAAIAVPTIGVITNVGETHIELLGSIENIAAAKAELLAFIPQSGLIILNGDDHYVREMAKESQSRVTLFGLAQGTLQAKNIRTDVQGMKFECHVNQNCFSVSIPTVGKHNVYNGLAAIAVALELNVTFPEICQGFYNFNPSPMRLHIETMGDYIVINDAYNASPMSMSAAIDTLVEVAPQRKVAVLGDMLELGDVAVAAHQQIGEKLAKCQIDLVVTVGELASHIAKAASEAGIRVAIPCSSHEEAQVNLTALLQAGDTILIKGSRGMKMENIINMF